MKETDKLTQVIANFDVAFNIAAISPFGSGHINDTYFVETAGTSSSNFLLQKINHNIFKNINNIIRNILLITSYLRVQIKVLDYGNAEQNILRLVPARDGAYYYKDEENQYWRVYYFLDNTRIYDTVTTLKQAFEGGKAFGRFQAMLSDLPIGLLSETIPNFLNMEKRLENFMQAVALNEKDRVAEVQDQIDFIMERAGKMCYFQQADNRKRLNLRAVHNDTRFNNVLLDQNDEAQCVIDLDTVDTRLCGVRLWGFYPHHYQ